jgi:secreted PhoX family phosphatase
MKGTNEGIVVTGGRRKGVELTQMNRPDGVWVDDKGTVYVAERGNYRVTRWPKGEREEAVGVGGNGCEDAANQFHCPSRLSFDQLGNMYVVDWGNHRVQQFELENN